MDATLRRLSGPLPAPPVPCPPRGAGLRQGAAGLLALAYLLPLGAAMAAVVTTASGAGWLVLRDDPRTLPALRHTLVTATVATLLALLLALVITTATHGRAAWTHLVRSLPCLLAVPHAALAIGLSLIVMPSGLLARLIAPLAGWTSPPDWPSVHDPAGLLLIAVLVLKELPFLLWTLQALLDRPDVAGPLAAQLRVARSLGYGTAAAWWRVLWPQWLPRLAGPLLAVAAYAACVVDVALIVGPQTPPTLAVLAAQWLQDPDPLRQAQGAAAALALVAVLLLAVAAAALLWRVATPRWTEVSVSGRRGRTVYERDGAGAVSVPRRALLVAYLPAIAMLAFASLAGVWSFPSLLPQLWTTEPWRQAATGGSTLLDTALLAAATSLAAVVLGALWCALAPPRWDRRALPGIALPMVLPSLLLAAGLYRVALAAALDGGWLGLWAAHVLMALPYALLVLLPAWRSHDPRWDQLARALGRPIGARWGLRLRMLQGPLVSAAAVAFAVSVAQYLPTLFVGAGRTPTVTTEAVTLASGGQRGIGAAYALLQALLPLLGFGCAALVARRWRAQTDGR